MHRQIASFTSLFIALFVAGAARADFVECKLTGAVVSHEATRQMRTLKTDIEEVLGK